MPQNIPTLSNIFDSEVNSEKSTLKLANNLPTFHLMQIIEMFSVILFPILFSKMKNVEKRQLKKNKQDEDGGIMTVLTA